MDGIPVVTLIVKAPNQQIEDQIIKCDLSWTIKKLKGYLSEVYPSKPKTEEQKLIYSGQLLADSVVLKDVLRRYEGQETHTVHLVCAPSKDSQKSYSTSKLAMKTPSPAPVSSSSSASSSTAEPVPSTGTGSMINQRLDQPNVLTRRKIQPNSEVGQPSTSSTSVPMSQPCHSYQPQTSRTNMTENSGIPDYSKLFSEFMETQKRMLEQGYIDDSQMYTSQLAFFQQAYMSYLTQYMQLYAQRQRYLTENKIQPNIGTNVAGNSLEQNRLQPVEEAPPRAPPEPVQNVNVNAMDGEDGIIDRDWLDWFYVVSRLTVLLGIVYFYSSPLRFIFVFVLGCTMYLYQIGFFRGHLENNAIHNNNNNNNNNRNNNIQREPPRDGNQEQNNPPGTNPPTPPVQNIIERPTVLGVMWTFFTTFFASLIPEVPNAV